MMTIEEFDNIYPESGYVEQEKKLFLKYFNKFRVNVTALEEVMKSSGSPKPLDHIWVILQQAEHEFNLNEVKNYNDAVELGLYSQKEIMNKKPTGVNIYTCSKAEFREDEYKVACKKNPKRKKEKGMPREIKSAVQIFEHAVEKKIEITTPYLSLLKIYKKYNDVDNYIRIGKLYFSFCKKSEWHTATDKDKEEIIKITENRSF